MGKGTVLILGSDGYLGHALSKDLNKKGYYVVGVDNYSMRYILNNVLKTQSVIERPKGRTHCDMFYEFDISNNKEMLDEVIKAHQPHTIFNFAHQPRAPVSMKNLDLAKYTTNNNVDGTFNLIYSVKEHCPDAHLIVLGTMGEYPTDVNVPIPEGDFSFEYQGMKSNPVPFPREGGSWYHFSKISMSNMYRYACKIWGLRVSDIMQGVIYGCEKDDWFTIDEAYGTVVNRFVSQSIIGMPLTVYGEGDQQRAYLSLNDAINCYNLIMNTTPISGTYELYNQFDESYSVNRIADIVKYVGSFYGLDVEIKRYDNPRFEAKQDKYMPVNDKLKTLGYKRTETLAETLISMFETLVPYSKKIENLKDDLEPKTQWGKLEND